MDNKIFEEIGLTPAETKVYIALLKTGEINAGPLLEKTGLQNSTLHKTLHRLISKGFASFVVKGKRRLYRAADPSHILKFIEENKRKFESIMPDLKNFQKPVEKQEAVVYEGFNGLKTMLYELIEDGKKGDEYLFFAFYTENPDDNDNVYLFYKDFEFERKKRGIKVKGIAPESIRSKFKGRDTSQVVFVNFPVPMNIGVFKDKIIFTPWEDGQVSYLVYSKQLAESFRKYFYSVWISNKKG